MKKQSIIPCTLTAALLAALATTSALAAKKQGPARVELPRVAPASSAETFHRFVIEYKQGAKERSDRNAVMRGVNAAVAGTKLTVQGKAVNASYMRKLATGHQLIKTSAKLNSAQAQAFINRLKADPNVASVIVDRKRKFIQDVPAKGGVRPNFIPNDPLFASYQWHFDAPDGAVNDDGGPNRGGANVTAAWDAAQGDGIVIAVLDTGITAHPDIDTSLADAGYDFISDAETSGRADDSRVPGGWDTGDWTTEEPWLSSCTNPITNPPSDSSWHGTHVAATAGAELTNNGVGLAGVAYNAKILPIRVLGHCGGYDSDINDAIVWAAGGSVDGVPDNENPAEVINLSLGGGGACPASDPAAQAIALANSLGASVVVSAGNSNADAAGYSPASCPGAITVASNGITSRRAYYSNYGASVEIAAPGGGVYANDGSSGTQIYDGFVWQALNPGTTTPLPVAQITAQNGYGGYAGTSQAAPHVSGTIALMHAARASAGMEPLTPAEVLEILQDTAATPAVAPPANRAIGAGILDAAAAVEAASVPPCEVDCAPDAIALTNKVVLTGLSGAAGSETLYSIEVPEGVTGPLSILTYGGSGDVSMYVSFDEEPTTTEFDAKSVRAGNSETVRFNAVQAGTYYIKLVGARAYSNVSLVARHNDPVGGAGNELEVTDIAGAAGSEQFWTLNVPAGAASLTFTLSPLATGDADLYVNFGTAPTTTTYSCRPYLGGSSAETCTIANPQAGTWHVMVRGYSAFTGGTLTGNY